jgi:hypothetical protein
MTKGVYVVVLQLRLKELEDALEQERAGRLRVSVNIIVYK